MFNSGPSGYQNAPLSKALMFITVGASVLTTVMNARDRLNLPSLVFLTQRMQLWRFFTNTLFFTTPGEALFGTILLYAFRLFERQMGTSKFGAYTLSTFAINSLLQLGVLTFFPARSIVSGPYFFIFASLVLFHYTIPVTNRFHVFGMSVNDKFFTYIIGLQLLFSHSWSSFLTGLCGITSGLLYTGDVLRLRQFQLPSWVSRICSTLFLPLLQSTSSPARSIIRRRGEFGVSRTRTVAGAGGWRDQELPATQYRFEGAEQFIPVSEDNVGALTSMGFPREVALQALQQSNNDLQHATNLLLDSTS